jgi:hypothetical protein
LKLEQSIQNLRDFNINIEKIELPIKYSLLVKQQESTGWPGSILMGKVNMFVSNRVEGQCKTF